MQADSFPRLVGDIGGTNARFAWIAAAGAELTEAESLPGSDYPGLTDAMRAYLARHAYPAPRRCAIGIANPVVGDHVQMTNHDWSFSISQVQREMGLERFLVINDFTALALSLTALQASDLRQVGGGKPVDGAPLALLGPGTGLGVSGLLPAGAGPRAIPLNGEGGHVTLPAVNEREEQVIAALRRRFGHASAERALSGPGIVTLHQALQELGGGPAVALSAADITARALAGGDPHCVETMDLFFSLLGTVAGNLALSLGSLGGVYIGGGIVPRTGTQIDRSRFRASFEGKGRFRSYLQGIPVYVIEAKMSPALVGAARALDDL
jgi:glucokinase